MNSKPPRFEALLTQIVNSRHYLVPAMLLSLVAVLVVPLPPQMLDILLAANISLSAVILLTTVYTKSPLDFSVFPALLLITTLGRLVLNVASTRLILSADASSPQTAAGMAGQVIETFGGFVAGSSIVVGAIIFLILVIVQFVVVTKGATRMSEVAARFTLDAMPGRQMAIDADLSAGLIDERDATQQRDRVLREADFYGAMDGASKFVRGDAIAGLVIIVINIIGGLAVGIIDKGWSPVETFHLFTRLTIGDGLASQIPSFLIAIAAGLIVARAGDRRPLGVEIPSQLVSQPAALALVAGFLVVLSVLTPLPTLPLLILAVVLGGLAWSSNQQRLESNAPQEDDEPIVIPETQTSVSGVDALQLELGIGLLSLAQVEQGGELLDRISAIRASVLRELGLVVPPIRVLDDIGLEKTSYRIRIRNGIVGEGKLHRDRQMVVVGEEVGRGLDGIREKEPVFGLSALWITQDRFKEVRELGLTSIDSLTVLVTHLSRVVMQHAAELLSWEEVSRMVDILKKTSPRLVDDAFDEDLTISKLHQVLKALLAERVPVIDMETIVEISSDYAHGKVETCVEKVRIALRRQICSQVSSPNENGNQSIHCITLPPAVEAVVGRSCSSEMHPKSLSAALEHAVLPLINTGRPAVVVVSSSSARRLLRETIAPLDPSIVILSQEEIVSEVELQVVGTIDVASRAS
ncbi:MAG: flagellar biosynthesis protein FlhA [Phycisphaerales bacterium]|jgi:flagellar biosynthesis protein FlhA|nr:flagellar biosynthesis protein FlhA [Phycisphaerales bacterium]